MEEPMATTRIIPMHINKGKTIAQCMKARIDYVKDPDKTEDGEFISSYACAPESADQEFVLARNQYLMNAGNGKKNEVIAYQLRQSFKPGEVSAEEANQIGYELAERLLHGEHAFIVATHAPSDIIARKFGKNGLMVQAFANGTDCSAVAPVDYSPAPKSIGHGATCTRDLEDNYSVWLALDELAQDVSHRMIASECKTKAVHLYVKDNSFMYHEYVAPIHYPTQSAAIIAQASYELFLLYYRWEKPVRVLTITASKLQDEKAPDQLDMFGDYLIFDKRNRLDRAIDDIRNRFGKDAIFSACQCRRRTDLATDKCETVKMPGVMYH